MTDKKIFLTFDDGPVPEVTPWVLEQLAKYKASATFFCVGENALKYPSILKQVRKAGHQLGNHTFHHLNGWITENQKYYKDISQCSDLVKSSLFRPPYGKIKPRQSQHLQKNYQIVMWDVLSGDFDPTVTVEKCFQNVISNAQKGSIVVFHDSLKAKDKLKYVLPKVLKHYTNQGFTFEPLQAQSFIKAKIAS